MPAAAAKLDPDTLVPGWAAEDVARLDKLADLGMDLARTLTKQVLAHDAACERGEAKPVSAADAAKIAPLDQTAGWPLCVTSRNGGIGRSVPPMTDPQRLSLLRALHTAIYLVMATACLVVLYGGVTGARGPWLWVAAGLVALESMVFAVSGLRCPLTAVAVKYGAVEGSRAPGAVFDTFLPEALTRHTATVFTPIIVAGFALLAWRWGAGG